MNTQGAIAAIKAFREASLGQTVSTDEIKDRVKICNACPLRQSSSIFNASRIMGMLVNKHRVPKELSDWKCGSCKCNLALLIPAITPHQDSPEERKVRLKNPNCWVLLTNSDDSA